MTGFADHFAPLAADYASFRPTYPAELFAWLAEISPGTAPPHPGVEYRVAPAEDSGLEDASVDLIAVAQALHWFDLERFYAEARRVLAPDGILAAWTYGVLHVAGEEIDRAVQVFYSDTVGPYWPPERRLVESGYRTLPFPFAELSPPPFVMAADWNLAQLLGYFRSWSATGRYIAARGHDPATRRRITWPLSLRAGENAAPC